MPKEVITLQFGHYANFVGTHFWNLQEASFSYDPKHPTSKEIDLNVLHREGETLRGAPTFTPRVVLCDFKGSLKSLPSSGGLYDGCLETTSPSWNGDKLDTTIEDVPTLNKYLQEIRGLQQVVPVAEQIPRRPRQSEYGLEKSVHVWSDYLGIPYHPRSINHLENFWLDGEQSFDLFGHGAEEWRKRTVQEPLEDSIRRFVEECENLQAFQLFMDAHDGFAGFGTSIVDYIAEEYSAKSVLIYPIFPSQLSPEAHGYVS